jgi:hypothetical protein
MKVAANVCVPSSQQIPSTLSVPSVATVTMPLVSARC